MNTHTAPDIVRAPMRARPWFGLRRGLMLAAWPGLRWGPAEPAEPAPAWMAAARQRRRVLLAALLALATGAAGLGQAAGLAGVPLVLTTLLLAWIGIGLVTASMGAWVMLRGDPHAPVAPEAGTPIARSARTAVIMPICNEDIATVFGGLRATAQSLAATGALPLFDFYILSDTPDPALRRAELAAWHALRESLGDADAQGPGAPGGRIFYRVRRRRSERKAGNVSDFCRRWGRNYRYMVVLDADSTMQGETLVSLVRTMEANPRAGIMQTLPQSVGHDTLHARAQQFASRVTGRLLSLGMAYWQLGDSHYWGHNAILRVAPFMAHCRMAPLPGRGGLAGPILSHDFVEAAMMRRAGYEVWVLPTLGGSWEQTPPNLLDELQRDRRWCQGNLQNARLIAEPGWQPAHRAMFFTGAMSYVSAPLWLALLASGWLWARDASTASWAGPLLWMLTLTVLLLPRVLGVAAVLLRGEQSAHGGMRMLLAGSALEALLAALQAPVRMLAHSAFVLGALTGLKLEWRSPPRDAQAVSWRDALARVGLLALPAGALLMVGVPERAETAPRWDLTGLAIGLPLLLAVPLVMLSGRNDLGRALRRRTWLAVREELQPPHTLRQASHAADFAALQASAIPHPAAAPSARGSTGAAWPRGAWSAGAAAILAVALLTPRPAIGPIGPNADIGRWASPPSSAHSQVAVAAKPTRPTSIARRGSPERRQARMPRPDRPARYIDDAVRERALRAVRGGVDEPAPFGPTTAL